MQRFGRKAVYIVIGDGVEEEQGAKKVTVCGCYAGFFQVFIPVTLSLLKHSMKLPPFETVYSWSHFFMCKTLNNLVRNFLL